MAQLSVEQKKAVRAYFDELSLMHASQWREHLECVCSDTDVIEETLTLLRMRTGTTDHIQKHVSQMLEHAELPELDVGDNLGFWRLIEKIGSGGMGTVFLAERADGMYERKVADAQLVMGQREAARLTARSALRTLEANETHHSHDIKRAQTILASPF